MRGLRILLALLLLTIALPAIFAFEGLSAVTAVFLNKNTWYDVIAAPEIYDALIGELQADLETPAQREALRAALTPEYTQTQLNKLIDYLFAVLDGQNPDNPIFDIPPSLVETLRQNPESVRFDMIEQPNGGLGFVIDVGEGRFEQIEGFGRQFALFTIITAGIGFFLWVIAATLGGENTRERFFWLGVTLIFGSFGMVVLGTAGLNSVIEGITTELSRSSEATTALDRALSNNILDVVPRFANALIFAGGIPCAFGLLLIVIGSIIPARRRE